MWPNFLASPSTELILWPFLRLEIPMKHSSERIRHAAGLPLGFDLRWWPVIAADFIEIWLVRPWQLIKQADVLLSETRSRIDGGWATLFVVSVRTDHALAKGVTLTDDRGNLCRLGWLNHGSALQLFRAVVMSQFLCLKGKIWRKWKQLEMSFLCVGSEFTVFFSKGLAKGSPVLLELLSCKAWKANVSVKVYLCHIYYSVAKVIALVIFLWRGLSM